MTMMEALPTTIAAPLILRNLLTSIFEYADIPLAFLAEKHKLLQVLRCVLVSAFLFFLRVLLALFPCLIPSDHGKCDYNYYHPLNKPKKGGENCLALSAVGGGRGGVAGGGDGSDAGIARALSQLLYLVNDIPVSSRKYEIVRCLAERLLDDNLLEGNEALREINCRVLSAAFTRTIAQLEAAVVDQCHRGGGGNGDVMVGTSDDYLLCRLSRFLRGVKYYADILWQRRRPRGELGCDGSSAEKLPAELLWLAQKMTTCGCADDAVRKWASADNLGRLALSAEPRLQGSLVKVSAFLIKQAKDIRSEDEDEAATGQVRLTKMKMLMVWLPLLCRGSIGTDAPVLSVSERAELERILEEIIETLEQEEEQERVLSLWLYHFTSCASSDWPNLQKCYTRWCDTSRRLWLLQWH